MTTVQVRMRLRSWRRRRARRAASNRSSRVALGGRTVAGAVAGRAGDEAGLFAFFFVCVAERGRGPERPLLAATCGKPAQVLERFPSSLIDALAVADEGGESRATSLRIPASLHRAVVLATELGMDESFTAATSRALTDRLRDFVRREALAEHFHQFPSDVPTLAAVAHRRVRGSDHPAASRPELIDQVAAWIAGQRPEWARTGAVDETVDEVLSSIAMLAAGVGSRRRRSA